MRALRKELLIARADVERMEIAQATTDLRYSVTHFSFLKMLIPGRKAGGFGKGRAASSGGGILSLLTGLLSGGNLGSFTTLCVARRIPPRPRSHGTARHRRDDRQHSPTTHSHESHLI